MMDQEAFEIIREFISDVEAVGVSYVSEEWPDLLVTYERAQELVLKADKLARSGRLE